MKNQVFLNKSDMLNSTQIFLKKNNACSLLVIVKELRLCEKAYNHWCGMCVTRYLYKRYMWDSCNLMGLRKITPCFHVPYLYACSVLRIVGCRYDVE